MGKQLPRDWRRDLFVPLFAYLSSEFSLEGFPDDTQPDSLEEFKKVLSDQLAAITLSQLLEMRNDNVSAYLKAYPVPNYAANAKKLREFTRGDKDKAFRIEARTVAERSILPVLDRLPLLVKIRLGRELTSLPQDKDGSHLTALLDHLPAIKNHIEIMAISSQDPNRKDQINDFFDHDLLPIPLAYCDVLVAEDKRINMAIKNRSSHLRTNTCTFFGNIADFGNWLGNVLDE